MKEVVKKEVIHLLDVGIFYPIYESGCISQVHCVPKKGEITLGANGNEELIL
jgi:hypothetical protein